jgi:hypothetical protein
MCYGGVQTRVGKLTNSFIHSTDDFTCATWTLLISFGEKSNINPSLFWTGSSWRDLDLRLRISRFPFGQLALSSRLYLRLLAWKTSNPPKCSKKTRRKMLGLMKRRTGTSHRLVILIKHYPPYQGHCSCSRSCWWGIRAVLLCPESSLTKDMLRNRIQLNRNILWCKADRLLKRREFNKFVSTYRW